MRRYFSLVGVPSLAPAVAMAKAEAAERALRLLSSSRHEDTTMPLLKENRENSTGMESKYRDFHKPFEGAVTPTWPTGNKSLAVAPV
ncbi:hypothetical protein EYF80_019602 [Liparis tanakae]|uniref:Uncharacterized protein n=1 Tax=Liparis tanakae TaxID=230148 RepID=A0A4Z2HYT3_9TELE|nr:hypothetical protein EYF80_019602 [Liparis tanakae]